MSAARLDPKLKFALELGPLALFFLAYWKLGIMPATGVMVAAVLASLAVSYAKLRRVPIMPLVTAVIVVVFAALAYYFKDTTFIKMKPTVLYSLFAAALFFGLVFRRPILQVMFDGALSLTEEGWRILSWRWAFFFMFLAILNEYIWRHYSESAWVTFKSFGFMPLTIVFALAQMRVIMKYEDKAPASEDAL